MKPTPSPTESLPGQIGTPVPTASVLQPTPLVQPTNGDWDTLIGALALLVAVATLLFGLKKPELSTLWKSILYVLDVVALIAGMILLGWLGFILFMISLLIGLTIHSIRLAMRLETILVGAAIEGRHDTQAMKDLHKSIHRSHQAFRWLGSIETAELIRELSRRARPPSEIKEMALPIAMLLAVFDPGPMDLLVERFDRLLRLAQKPAGDATSVANTLTVATQQGAASFTEMLDALISFYGAFPIATGNGDSD